MEDSEGQSHWRTPSLCFLIVTTRWQCEINYVYPLCMRRWSVSQSFEDCAFNSYSNWLAVGQIFKSHTRICETITALISDQNKSWIQIQDLFDPPQVSLQIFTVQQSFSSSFHLSLVKTVSAHDALQSDINVFPLSSHAALYPALNMSLLSFFQGNCTEIYHLKHCRRGHSIHSRTSDLPATKLSNAGFKLIFRKPYFPAFFRLIVQCCTNLFFQVVTASPHLLAPITAPTFLCSCDLF